MCVCVCMRACVHTCVCACMHAYVFVVVVYVHWCVLLWLCVCVCMRVHVCVLLLLLLCECARACVCARVCVLACMRVIHCKEHHVVTHTCSTSSELSRVSNCPVVNYPVVNCPTVINMSAGELSYTHSTQPVCSSDRLGFWLQLTSLAHCWASPSIEWRIWGEKKIMQPQQQHTCYVQNCSQLHL